MNFEDWQLTVPAGIRNNALWQMKVYRVALFASDVCWHDVTKLVQDKRTISLADQLFRSTGSIDANLAEGYSKRSGKDRARFYEYALGSAREARGWYFKARHVLGAEVAEHRINLLVHVIRLLLTIVPQERKNAVREAEADYGPNALDGLLSHIPLPDP